MKQLRFGWVLLAAAIVLHMGFVTPVAAKQTDPVPEDESLTDDYVAGDFGRLLYQENGVTMRRSSADADSSLERVAGLNAPVFPGDGVITAFDQRAEIQLAGGSLVRIDRASDLTFLSLPDPYAEIADNTVLQLEQGIIRIDALLSSDSEFRIDTPGATAFLLDDADVRIEVDESGVTHVASFRGVIEVVADDERILLRSGNRTAVYPGSAPERPVAFNTLRLDDFGRWVRERNSLRRSTERYADSNETYEELPEEVRPYYRELSSHGRWAHADDYGWVWYPGSVGSDWRPYYDGYWSYGSRGYFWISHEPWGWAPYHYGRWGYVGGSWCWIPGRVFGGAWVAWSWGSAYVGWSPLGYWNSVYCGTPYYYGYYGPSWSFVNYNHFHYRNYRRHAVRYNHIDRRVLTTHAVVTRPPRARPRDLARSADARDRAYREARDDRRRMRPADDEQRRAGNGLRGTERRLVSERRDRIDDARRRNGQGERDTRDRGPGVRGGGVRAGDARERGQRRIEDGRGSRNGTDVAPRTGSQGGIVRSGTTRQRDGGGDSNTNRDTADRRRGTTRPSEGSRNNTDTRRRMRDVYERAAEPRRSGSDRKESAGSDSDRSTRPRTTPRSTRTETRQRSGSERNTPKATPRRSSGGSSPKAAPKRGSSGSRQRATPSRSSGGSRPKATPKAQPKAKPKRNSGGNRPSATQNRSSGGSRPSARPSRSSGGNRPSAKPSRSSGGSRPSAKPSRSSGGSRPKAGSSRSRGSKSGSARSRGKKN